VSIYDLAIIGGGPGGLTAGIYGSRAKLNTVIFEKAIPGGQAYTTRELVNYPAFPGGTTGPDLTQKMQEHAREFGTEIIKEEIVDLQIDDEIKILVTGKGNEYKVKTIILAPGAEPRLLNIQGEQEFKGNGVSYCATCDAEFYEDQTVVVVGNGDAAIEEAIYLAKFAQKVIVIVIHDQGIVDCNKFSAERAFNNSKIEFVWNSVLSKINGKDEVSGAVIKNLKTGELSVLSCEGVFIYIGIVPRTDFLKGKIKLDEKGYIITNEKMETSAAGVYAIGDARAKYLRQVVTAANDGAIAAVSAERYILEEEAFKEQIQNANQTVVLAFWSPLSEVSINKLVLLDKLILERKCNMKLVKVDISRNQRIASKYNVEKIPAIFLLDNKGQITQDWSEELIENLKLPK